LSIFANGSQCNAPLEPRDDFGVRRVSLRIKEGGNTHVELGRLYNEHKRGGRDEEKLKHLSCEGLGFVGTMIGEKKMEPKRKSPHPQSSGVAAERKENARWPRNIKINSNSKFKKKK